MSEPLASYLAGWRDADPLNATLWWFLRPAERVRFAGLAALEREWLRVIHEVAEPQVAMARLGWWREELERAATGDARHPLVWALFDDSSLRRIGVPVWMAVVDAACLLVDVAPASDLAAQQAALAPLASAMAELETRAWFGPGTSGSRAAWVLALNRLASNVRGWGGEVERGRSPLPMNLLARHGLAIADLAADSPPRRAALRQYTTDLRRELAGAARMPGPLTLFADACLRRDLRALRMAARADEPLGALRASGRGLRNVFDAWHAARHWRHVTEREEQDDF